MRKVSVLFVVFASIAAPGGADDHTRATPTFQRIKKSLDAVPAIDTHDHLWPFERLPGYVETDRGRGMNLYALWRNSYFTGSAVRSCATTPWNFSRNSASGSGNTAGR